MSTTPDHTTPAHHDDETIPLWLEALSWTPWALFFPTCASDRRSGVRTSRRSRQVKP